jgi:hypothetical protein
MMNLQEFQLAGAILELVENIQDVNEGKTFIQIYIKSYNHALVKLGYNPLDGNQVLRFIIQVDPRFNNLVY